MDPRYPILDLFPVSAAATSNAHLTIGGCDVTDLARTYGTPLYIFDEATLRGQAQSFIREFGSRYPDLTVLYASKAYINKSIARIFAEEGLGFDVVSGGELAIVHGAEVPLDRVYFHGNNKSRDELALALDRNIGRIVIDNLYEMEMIEELAKERGKTQAVMVRITPGVDPHTHAYISTGATDVKFGFSLATGAAADAVAKALQSPHLDVVGIHMHIGSQLFETNPYTQAIDGVLGFAAQMVKEQGLNLREFSPGGGYAIQYVPGQEAPPLSRYAQTITDAVRNACSKHGLSLPRLVLEPGRSMVGRAGVALYSVGAIKEITGIRKYVSVDGGMADNIRPALYEARYDAAVANRLADPATETVTIAGKYCESGDILIKDLRAPELHAGDLLALPAAGAYCLAMSSNYNVAPRPAVVLVNAGKSRIIRRRETYADLMQWDE